MKLFSVERPLFYQMGFSQSANHLLHLLATFLSRIYSCTFFRSFSLSALFGCKNYAFLTTQFSQNIFYLFVCFFTASKTLEHYRGDHGRPQKFLQGRQKFFEKIIVTCKQRFYSTSLAFLTLFKIMQ